MVAVIYKMKGLLVRLTSKLPHVRNKNHPHTSQTLGVQRINKTYLQFTKAFSLAFFENKKDLHMQMLLWMFLTIQFM